MKLSPMKWTDYTFKPMTTINAQIETPHAGIKYSGAKWFQNHFKISEISPLTVRVANVLGQVYAGIYNTQTKRLKNFESSAKELTLTIDGPMGTYDGDRLTRLFLCCQAASLEVSISGSIGCLSIAFKDSGIKTIPSIPVCPEISTFEELADLESPEWRSLILKSNATYLTRKSPWLSVQWMPDGAVSALSIRSGFISMDRLSEIISRSHSSCCRIELFGRCPLGHGQIGMYIHVRSPESHSIARGHPTAKEAIENLRSIWDIDYESLN